MVSIPIVEQYKRQNKNIPWIFYHSYIYIYGIELYAHWMIYSKKMYNPHFHYFEYIFNTKRRNDILLCKIWFCRFYWRKLDFNAENMCILHIYVLVSKSTQMWLLVKWFVLACVRVRSSFINLLLTRLIFFWLVGWIVCFRPK